MSHKKTAVVFGATGMQGCSVVRALLRSGEFHVRGVARDIQSQTAQGLIQEGVELIQCDLCSHPDLHPILHMADVCFVNTATNFEDQNCLESETAQGCLIADYCRSEGVQHVIFSSQLNSYKICGVMARHLVAKAEIEQYMRKLELPLTCLIIPINYEDFLTVFHPKTSDGKTYEIELPMGTTPMDIMSVEDVGTAVLCAVGQRDKYLHKTLTVCGDKLTTREIAQVFSKYLKPKVIKDKQITAHEWVQRNGDIPGSSDWANMFQFILRVDQKYNLASTKKLNVGLQSLDHWVRENIRKVDAAFSAIINYSY